ncbi:AbrB/MazE/SpoVT family DNA-binding domain-containing protein [Paenibacillus apiarius]|uniref:AbrB/MazE/SpoVT family DNA-binding domain-containing protein n=1 Tax=Paenibacillus apiarius TaxID=46240 RepID=A0ABT4DZJ4_9BACL|nr:hypothetical protein [Paenibacillus apiarius]MBN3523949.1 AbrB/MazE/SpoVT family DNA-binding domain-containing protein [Paenibacillus apiarius]MCY9516993.1 AbrB/MazE/SpoVT family DNA-binding domain-containing protein [Paenibacillus apiarius]MCY9522771.1 AbrB/MazE/SpoVT family DNA-binding domain-containing protein [Paenibacillus apiarius]MCY9554680.1 AbrB/MazE/SpoVT family DNA-binding domain-containing protein [Paenibacillus apiarius]MCY9557335.1 AbrB/MazE/SpoVT family DNA-binding domain-con
MRRKLLRIGNSFGLILTKDILSKLKAEYGDLFEMEVREQTGEIVIRKVADASNRNRIKKKAKLSV